MGVVFVRINGKRHCLWRGVDHVLEGVVTKRRNKRAALKVPRKLMQRYGQPDVLVTDRLPSYRAALRDLGWGGLQKLDSVHASISNRFDQKRSLSRRGVFKRSRAVALAEWRDFLTA